MANVKNNKTGEYLESVHTPDYLSDPDWEINPTQERCDEIDQSLIPQFNVNTRKADLELRFEQKSRSDIEGAGFEYDGKTISTSESKQRRLEALDNRIQRDKVPFNNGIRIAAENLTQLIFTDKSSWDTFADAYYANIMTMEQNIVIKKVELGVLTTEADLQQWENDNL
jgi:hypothetical protein